MIRGYLTQRPGGLHVVSYMPPAIARTGTTESLDVFVSVGDGFGQHKIPASTIRRIWGEDEYRSLVPLKPRRVAISGNEGVDIFLSRRGAGHGFEYMISEFPPRELNNDWWPIPGDEIYCGDFCDWFAEVVWKIQLKPLDSVQVKMSGTLIQKE